jgi:glycosyltransferase involved in cell wall biosynthesis
MTLGDRHPSHVRSPAQVGGIAVVIPCYRVATHIMGVLERIGPEVERIFVVDDCCPDGSGTLVREHCTDPRVSVIVNEVNQGVGGATMVGYRAAVAAGAAVVVKIDGDGQMDPCDIGLVVAPILRGDADYVKGNRFLDLEALRSMPTVRLFGNAILSFLSKLSSGYWDIFDPTNGYTAIHAALIQVLPLHKISRGYFFESDILFRLNTIRAVVIDVPMPARYGDEVSGLEIRKAVPEFLAKHAENFAKRVAYNYFLRNFSPASLELMAGVPLTLFGVTFGSVKWVQSGLHNTITSAGSVMLAALPIIVGMQLILAFLSHDVSMTPRTPIHRRLLPPGSAMGNGDREAATP